MHFLKSCSTISRCRCATARTVLIVLTVLLTIAGYPESSLSSQEPDSSEKKQEPPVEKVSEGVYKIGSTVLDRNTNEIYLSGEVNMSQGMIEYLACARWGKLHESLLVLDVEPYHLQVALLLMGLEPRGNLQYQGDSQTPQGDSLEIWIEWENKEKLLRYRAEDLVFNIARQKPMRHTPWIFTGSRIAQGTFMADVEGSLIATYHDPYAILDHPLPTGADDTLYRVNEKLVPEKGTPLRVILKSLNPNTNTE
jgi:hypothetical protein